MKIRRAAIAFPYLWSWCLLGGQEPASDARQRAKEARDLGKQGPQAIATLERYVADSDLDVRREAVKAIVAVGSQRSLDPLIRATADNDSEIQVYATDGLVSFYIPGYVRSGISGSLQRASSKVKGKFTDTNDQAIDPFVEVKPGIIAALEKLVQGGSSMESRIHAARALGILRGRPALPALIEALRSKDDSLIYESLIAIQKFRDPSAAPSITFLLRDFTEKVQIAALETTGLLQNKEAAPAVRDALERARSQKVRRAALTAIAMMPMEQDRQLFSRYQGDRDDELRTAAAEGFARLKNANDVETLKKAFNEESKMPPRLALAFALVSLGNTEMDEYSPLKYLINSLNSNSYHAAAQAYLTELARDGAVRKAIYPAFQKASKEEKIYLGQVFAASGDTESVIYLEPLTADLDTEVAHEGLKSLRLLKARLP